MRKPSNGEVWRCRNGTVTVLLDNYYSAEGRRLLEAARPLGVRGYMPTRVYDAAGAYSPGGHEVDPGWDLVGLVSGPGDAYPGEEPVP